MNVAQLKAALANYDDDNKVMVGDNDNVEEICGTVTEDGTVFLLLDDES